MKTKTSLEASVDASLLSGIGFIDPFTQHFLGSGIEGTLKVSPSCLTMYTNIKFETGDHAMILKILKTFHLGLPKKLALCYKHKASSCKNFNKTLVFKKNTKSIYCYVDPS
jgi:hypothetical protein